MLQKFQVIFIFPFFHFLHALDARSSSRLLRLPFKSFFSYVEVESISRARSGGNQDK